MLGFCLVACLLHSYLLSTEAFTGDEELLIGWKGETYNPLNISDHLGVSAPRSKLPRIENVAWNPRVFIYFNFLSDQECAHLRRLARPHMRRSFVVGANGSAILDPVRTSYGTFLRRLQDPVVESITQRLAVWSQMPATHQEDMQVLHYGVGERYLAHYDSVIDETPRIATVLLYLNDVEEGGETAFPEGSKWLNAELETRMGPFSECARGQVAFKPRKGDALMFWSLRPDGTVDPAALHSGCPIIKGVKWTATSWIHTNPWRVEGFKVPEPGEILPDPGLCKDLHPSCAEWAKMGECTNTAPFMLGSSGGQAHCRRSCGACEPCQESDMDCINRNRAKLGYLVVKEEELAV